MSAAVVATGGALRRFATRAVAALEPWYNWGRVGVERMEGMHVADGILRSAGEGEVRYFELQWFGLHMQVQLGRTPKRGSRA